MGLREDIKRSAKPVQSEQSIEALGGTKVGIRIISAGDRATIGSKNGSLPWLADSDGEDLLQAAKLVLVGTCNPDGSRIWNDSQFDDVLAVSGDAIDEMGLHVARANKMLKEAPKELAKNSETIQADSSLSDSA